MTEGLELASVSASYLSRYLLALTRVLGAVSLNPVLGSARVPLPARLGLGLFVTLVLFPPGAPDAPPLTLGPLELAGELLVGLLAGFAVALVFAAIQVGASLLSTNMGFGIGAVLDPSVDLGGAGLERFFSTFALLIFVQIDGHHLFLAALHELFRVVELGGFALSAGSADRLALLSAGLFSVALKMALPVLAALLLADLALALLTRVAPQFNLFALGLPAKVVVGLAALLVGLPIILPRLAALFRALPGQMLELAG